MMGGALGLAVLASLAAAQTQGLSEAGAQTAAALTGGYHVAFLLGSVFAVLAAVLGLFVLRQERQPAVAEDAIEAVAEAE